MLHMMKRDYYINKMYFLVILVALPFIYVFTLSPLFIFIGVIIGCVYNLFYYDYHNPINRFIVSLPISRKNIVLSRYLFIIIVTAVLSLYLLITDQLARMFLPMMGDWMPEIVFEVITPIPFMLIMLLIIIITAISIPLYYFFQSFNKSLIAQGVLLFIGIFSFALFGKYLDLIPEQFIHLILNLIDYQPIVFLAVFIAICLYISYKISVQIYSKKDIV